VTRTRLAALLLASALALAACSGGSTATISKSSDTRPTAGAADAGGGDLEWTKCTGKLTAQAGLQCASLDVPVDPAEPDGETISIALARKPSTGTDAERIGSLVMNPGGPGGSGLEFLAGTSTVFPSSITDHFDLVSFDPRGVAESSPVRCLDDEQKDEQLASDLTPDTPEEEARADEEERQFREGCEQRNPELARHMSTADVAADLDLIRIALGDDELNYLGYSYGTAIGATYAAMFPTTIRAMVLDGTVSPTPNPLDEAIVQATGFERTLANFVAACDADDTCALAPDAAAEIASVRQSLEDDPITVSTKSGERTLNRDLFDYGLATALYDTSTWGPTAQAIKDVRDGGAETILALVDRQTGRQSDGSYDNSMDSRSMVSCSDEMVRPTAEEAERDRAAVIAAAPTFGDFFSTGLDSCTDWPEPANPTPAPSAVGAPPILVIGTVGDPATPYEWAQEMTEALAGSVLLTYEGDGHTAFLRAGQCIEDAVVDYLVDLTLPPADTRCPVQSTSGGFGGVKDQLIEQLTDSGLPESMATCVVNGMIDRVGEAEFNDLVLKNEQAEITKLAQATALECATSGGG